MLIINENVVETLIEYHSTLKSLNPTYKYKIQQCWILTHKFFNYFLNFDWIILKLRIEYLPFSVLIKNVKSLNISRFMPSFSYNTVNKLILVYIKRSWKKLFVNNSRFLMVKYLQVSQTVTIQRTPNKQCGCIY